MTNKSIKPNVIFTPEQLMLLESTFKEIIASPGVSLDHLMYNGGTRKVVEFVRLRTPGAIDYDTRVK